MPGCGLEGDEAGAPGLEPGETEIELAQGAVTNVLDCATGETPNAIGHLGNSDGYTRNAIWANGSCGASSTRATTIVDFLGVSNTRYRFNMNATFGSAQGNLSRCANSLVAMRTLKSNGSGGWIEINYQEATPSFTFGTGSCFGTLAYIVPTAQLAPNGDYRVRARAIRYNGTFETVGVLGAFWN